jgi:hypothetical protein
MDSAAVITREVNILGLVVSALLLSVVTAIAWYGVRQRDQRRTEREEYELRQAKYRLWWWCRRRNDSH